MVHIIIHNKLYYKTFAIRVLYNAPCKCVNQWRDKTETTYGTTIHVLINYVKGKA